MEHGFQKSFRLRTKFDFKLLRDNSKAYRSKHLNIFFFSNQNEPNSRIGLSVSKKCGNAVERNFYKRLTREFFRRSAIKHKGLDLLVNFKPSVKKIPLEQRVDTVNSSLEAAFKSIEL